MPQDQLGALNMGAGRSKCFGSLTSRSILSPLVLQRTQDLGTYLVFG